MEGGAHLRGLAHGQHTSEKRCSGGELLMTLCPICPAREAFLCNVPSTNRTLLFSDKAWVYKRHFVLECSDCFMARWLGSQRREGSAALVLGSILVAPSLVTCLQQSGSSRQ